MSEAPHRFEDWRIRILIVDDHSRWRALVCSIFACEPDLQVIAEADDGLSGVQLAIGLSPDLVVMDIGLPELSGIEATRRILATSPGCRILLLTTFDSPDFMEAAMRCGACGYVTKSRAGDDLLPAIRAVLAGNVFLSAGICATANGFNSPSLGSGRLSNPFAAFGHSSAIQRSLESIVRGSRADFGNVQLFDSANNVLRIVAHVGFKSEFLEYFATVAHESNTVCSGAMAGRQRVVCRDICEYPFASNRATEVLLRAQVHSCQSTPLICQTCGFLGVVSTHYSFPGGPPPEVLTQVDDLTGDLIANLSG